MEKRLNEPVLIIKTSWGGRSLHTDFRPPSAGAENGQRLHAGPVEEAGRSTPEKEGGEGPQERRACSTAT